ncbi:uncharacterized protein LOC121990961 [Zingiber officinale]|uniref:uncharacterized protein LOC121990961 n=1 Tax=Zingiber officinale TaxID=94328 RepID=UPI001C4C1767|nr:uncharacterized protein LOC121990961 [Zingiber officinale]
MAICAASDSGVGRLPYGPSLYCGCDPDGGLAPESDKTAIWRPTFLFQAAPKTRSDFIDASPNPYRGRPAAFRSAPAPAEEDSPGDHQNPAPTEPVPEPPPAPPELWERVSELELQLNDPAQASYALRAEIQALTNQTDRQKRSLIQVKDELRAMREERAASEAGYQQQLAHQAREIQSKDTLLQEKNNKLEVQAAQLETQGAELEALRAELSQSRAALTGVSTALAVYQEGEDDHCLRSQRSYLSSPEFLSQAGARFAASVPYTAAGVIRQLHAQDFLRPPTWQLFVHGFR